MKNKTITLEVTDEQLEVFKQNVEKVCNGTCTDPLLFLTKLLQQECDQTSIYVDMRFDSGGNSIGDVFDEWDDFFIEHE